MAASQSLLDFILSLLGNADARGSFAADPDAALASAGLAGVCAEDVQDILPVVLDYAPGGGGGRRACRRPDIEPMHTPAAPPSPPDRPRQQPHIAGLHHAGCKNFTTQQQCAVIAPECRHVPLVPLIRVTVNPPVTRKRIGNAPRWTGAR